MISGAAGGASETTRNALDYGFVIGFDHKDIVQLQVLLGEQSIQRLGLGHGARKSVKDKPVSAVFLIDALRNHTDDHMIGHQFARVNDLPGLLADLASRSDFGPQHVPGRKLNDIERIL